MIRYKSICPSCKKAWGTTERSNGCIDSSTTIRNCTRTVTLRDKSGSAIGSSEVPTTEAVTIRTYENVCLCKHCGYEWSYTYTDDGGLRYGCLLFTVLFIAVAIYVVALAIVGGVLYIGGCGSNNRVQSIVTEGIKDNPAVIKVADSEKPSFSSPPERDTRRTRSAIPENIRVPAVTDFGRGVDGMEGEHSGAGGIGGDSRSSTRSSGRSTVGTDEPSVRVPSTSITRSEPTNDDKPAEVDLIAFVKETNFLEVCLPKRNKSRESEAMQSMTIGEAFDAVPQFGQQEWKLQPGSSRSGSGIVSLDFVITNNNGMRNRARILFTPDTFPSPPPSPKGAVRPTLAIRQSLPSIGLDGTPIATDKHEPFFNTIYNELKKSISRDVQN